MANFAAAAAVKIFEKKFELKKFWPKNFSTIFFCRKFLAEKFSPRRKWWPRRPRIVFVDAQEKKAEMPHSVAERPNSAAERPTQEKYSEPRLN